MKVTTGVIIFIFSVIPASAQFSSSTGCPPWFTFGCYQVQQAPPRPEPRHRRVRQETEPRKEHIRYRDNDRKPTVAPIVARARTVHRPTKNHEDDTWNGMSQDKARDWITKQANGFCNKYPTDVACHRPETGNNKGEADEHPR